MKIYLGHDNRELRAAHVAAKTLRETSRLEAEFLHLGRLRETGLLTRLHDRRDGEHYDLTSNERTSTDFKYSRFLVPILCQGGYSLFADCDVVFLRNVSEMLHGIDTTKAVHVVKHNLLPDQTPKMDGQEQRSYPRKNWSSVILWNTDHPANRRLTLHDVNTRSALWLHQFGWLHDDEIGALDSAWNWLVNVEPMPDKAGIAHFTQGGPFTQGWPGAQWDSIWNAAARGPVGQSPRSASG
jgi:hypothetical protein